jgi:hypothetical protein
VPRRCTSRPIPARLLHRVKTALQNAGNLNWNDVDDPDPTKERLVNVDAF